MKKKFVVYTSLSLQSYEEYGIGIPMRNDRVTIPFENAKAKYQIEETAKDSYQHLTLDDLSLCHTPEYLDLVRNNPDQVVLKTYELIKADGSYNRYDPNSAKKPLSEFIDKAMLHVNGTYEACQRALTNKFCYHLGGGMHHAMSFTPGGFCMFNDMVLTIRKMQKEGIIKKAMIIDMDAHKGDGTAEVSFGDDSIKTFSIHMKNGWPLDGDKDSKSFTPSDLDVGVLLEDDYLSIFKEKVVEFQNITGDVDLCIVVHGADVYEHDELESANQIKLTLEEVKERDSFIFNFLREKNIPQAWVMAGGYGKRTHEVFWQFLDYSLSELD
ncbi:histone deacetylase [Bacteriovorax sp. Seq25_V]|uniref:histone deacetylase n=1 Tax=Bacteriovorax sp. Seq25_V TaxID=1201288 RepID=UPI00038A13BB|nr:histone deacetylase [Bacteriovorax sp. Seq25_V]EQC46637.1 histone deacetylase family protein [Bacteriovorax sp. Seq25_V]